MHDDRPGAGDRTRAVYGIAVAAELVGVGVQTLRLYEAKGLIEPARTAGGTRRYSDADLDTMRRAIALIAEGVNLAGVARIMELEDDNRALRSLLADRVASA